MDLLKAFRWQGSGRVYTLPWLRNRLEYSSDPQRIAEYAKTPFTRSRFVMRMLTEFHLSRDSIVVSDDAHAKRMKRPVTAHLPADKDIPALAAELVRRALVAQLRDDGSTDIDIAEPMVRELYRQMLEQVLGVTLLRPLDRFITTTRFPHGSRPFLLEGLMYSLRMHSPLLHWLRVLIDAVFFKEVLYMKRTSRQLVQLICDFSIAKPGSLYEELLGLRNSGVISHRQFKGEINSILVSAFSLSSALCSSLLCLAALPKYRRTIGQQPEFSRYFVMEVLRLYPPFRQFGYQQEAAADAPHGLFRAENEFMIALSALHRDPQLWPDPHRFRAERFLDHRESRGYKYLPFGMGKRACPGRRFSLSLMAALVAHVCARDCPIELIDKPGLPRGQSGRLVAFPQDCRLGFRLARPDRSGVVAAPHLVCR